MEEPVKKLVATYIRPVAVVLAIPAIGFLLFFLVEKLFDVEISRLTASLINLVLVALFAFVILPRRLPAPFTLLKTPRLLGLYLPPGALRHILLGIVLAVCTLSGMMAASYLIGGYSPDLKNITLTHLVYSLNPALWEELFYRGILMVFLLSLTRSVKKAALIQVVIFSLAHIKGFQLWNFVDLFTVALLAVAFTYCAYKTRTLLAGIVFHYFHDGLLFFAQRSGDVPLSNRENMLFFGLLWVMIAVAMLVIKVAADRFGVRADQPLYLDQEEAMTIAQVELGTV